MTRLFLRSLLIGGWLMLAFTLGDARAQTHLGGSCGPTKTRFVVDTTMRTTVAPSPSGYEVLPGTTVNFTSGPAKSCVIVQFVGLITTNAVSTASVNLRAMLDGTIEPFPGAVAVGRKNTDVNPPIAATFVFADVPAGAHQVKMQFCCHSGTTTQTAQHTSVLVQYVP